MIKRSRKETKGGPVAFATKHLSLTIKLANTEKKKTIGVSVIDIGQFAADGSEKEIQLPLVLDKKCPKKLVCDNPSILVCLPL